MAEKQLQYQQVKKQNIRARSNLGINAQRDMDKNQENYYTRIEGKYKDAEKTIWMMKLLEQEEVNLINHL